MNHSTLLQASGSLWGRPVTNLFECSLQTEYHLQIICLVIEANSTTTYSGYDAALYSAATMYVAQQGGGGGGPVQQKIAPGGWQGYKKGLGAKNMRAKAPPKPQQLHYCDVCKIR